MLTLKGVVLAQRQLKEQDKFIDILTAEYGVLEIVVKGTEKPGRASAIQLFAYSEFCLTDPRRGTRMLNSVSPISIFYGLRSSVPAVALASYFSQILQFAVLPRAGTPELLRLMLNSLYFLSQEDRVPERIKAVFELRTASLLGFMPDVVMCRKCGAYLPKEAVFSVRTGGFCCRECCGELPHEAVYILPEGALQAVRHIVLSEPERIFSFRVSERSQKPLSDFAEAFLQYHIDRRLPALEYYKAVAE